MHYAKVKREKLGACNLCSKEAELTWDHVPPQGGIELSAVEMRTILQVLSVKETERRFAISQNGVKYRTICKTCNEWLGQQADPTLNKFANDVAAIVNTPLTLPRQMLVPVKVSRLLRGILAHLVSAKVDFHPSNFDMAVKNYVFDPSRPVPKGLYVFYWLYPYPQQIAMRDFLIPAVRGFYDNFAFCQLLKYFPIAYLVANVTSYEGLPELTRYRDAGPDDVVELLIDFAKPLPQLWPEVPDRGNALFGGQALVDSIQGVPRARHKRATNNTLHRTRQKAARR